VIWSGRPRLALSVGAATLVPIIALTWLGARVLHQDRDIERQRRRDRLEVAAGRLALGLERQLQETIERVARGEGIRMLPTGLQANSDAKVLYQPDVGSVLELAVPQLAAAESLEFAARDLTAAAHAYRPFTRASDTGVRAAALVALARVLRQTGDREGALRTYADLEPLGSTRVGGQPAALVALQGRCKVLEGASDAPSFQAAVTTLADAINTGKWPIDRGTYELYRAMLDRWGAPTAGADALVRTEAAIRLWDSWRAGEHLGGGYDFCTKRIDIGVVGDDGTVEMANIPVNVVKRWGGTTFVKYNIHRRALVGRDLLRAIRMTVTLDSNDHETRVTFL
jgi:hypothetical protein